jgi:hypothetical protein
MFASNEARTLKQHFRSLSQLYEGNNRRVIGLLPDPTKEEGAPDPAIANSNHHRLLVALEAEQRTCCLKMTSEKRKSRGALLIFRGRVLGTIYGSKFLNEQLLDRAAYARVCRDLADPDSSVKAYGLDQGMVIAAAALFHGHPFDLASTPPIENVFTTYLYSLMQVNMPGCLVVRDSNQLVVILAYVFAGRLVGLYSARDGWLPPVVSIAVDQVMRFPQATVSGSMLQARNVDEVFELTFSLSGLADRTMDNWTGVSGQTEQFLRITKVDPGKLEKLSLTTRIQQDRFIPNRAKSLAKHQINRNFKSDQYSTDP